MLAREVSQNYFKKSLSSIHATRANSLFEACWALTNHSDLTVSSIGKNKSGNAYVKHKIKSADRLIGNAKLYSELQTVYGEFYHPFLASIKSVHVIVDWSGCCRSDLYVLRASVVHEGRSITIYNEIHPQKKLGNPVVQKQFLANLKRQIPFGKHVIVITDAGFATPWFKAIVKLGWDYIGRMRGDTKILFGDMMRWIRTRKLYKKATNKIKYLGKGVIGSASRTRVQGHVYCYKENSKKRKDISKYPDSNKRYSKANNTPWVIVTTLNNKSYGKDYIIQMYANRMLIEQTFRDDKSPRFGFGWRYGRTVCLKRIAILCLIASIASFFLINLGRIGENLHLHRRYQVNTSKKRVLSLLTLARLILQHSTPSELINEYKQLTWQLLKNREVFYGR